MTAPELPELAHLHPFLSEGDGLCATCKKGPWAPHLLGIPLPPESDEDRA